MAYATTNTAKGISAANNLTADALVKSTAGRLVTVSVLTAGTAPGAVHDSESIANAAAGNKIATIPNTVGIYEIDWPCLNGIVYKVGTGQVVSIKFS